LGDEIQMMDKHILSGKYELTKDNPNNDKISLHLNKQQANFMFNTFIRLGFKEIKLLQEIHYMDIPKWERL